MMRVGVQLHGGMQSHASTGALTGTRTGVQAAACLQTDPPFRNDTKYEARVITDWRHQCSITLPPPPALQDRLRPIIQLERLSFGFPQCPLFDELSLQIPPGVTLIRGDEGAGKTTLLRLLAGELRPQSGDLLINGVRLSHNPQAYRTQLFWVDPNSTEFDQISALEYFARQRTVYPNLPEINSPELQELIAGLGLDAHIGKPMYMLSTGSKRKVWLAVAFACGAPASLLDDPFAALDRPSISFVTKLMTKVRGTALVVSHYEAIDAVPIARVLDLSRV